VADRSESLAQIDNTDRIGPNAIIRVAEALAHVADDAAVRAVFDSPDLRPYLVDPPDAMVPEAHVTGLQRRLREQLADATARAVNLEAGRRTGDYLLAHRIPRPAQALLKRLPGILASRLLLRAIGRHTWTFAGSGDVELSPGPPVRITIAGCPLCRELRDERPVCDYYASTFERLYRELVAPTAQARELACLAQGAPACVFEVSW
jgi:divinyl protochlorophyllide a 8-vinyl-reductase